METLAEQPPQIEEQFDRYLRTYNDATTWLAETLDGSMRTPFEYTFDGHELYADDGSSLGNIFEASLTDARRLVAEEPRLAFELRRRELELAEYADMLKMARGEAPNTMVVVSDFPLELMEATEDVGGYNAARKQTMLRVLAWQNGRLQMFSQSLDGSNRRALEAIYAHYGRRPEEGELLGQRIRLDLEAEDQAYLTDRLTGVYDRDLVRQHGGHWYAGRQESRHDTYQFVLSQQQLVDRFVSAEMHSGISDEDRYNVAALLSKRFEQFKRPEISVEEAELMFSGMTQNLEWQLRTAGDEARAEGKMFSGCGVSADSKSAQDQLAESGYGNKSDQNEDKFGPLEFKCKNGHTNRRPRNQLIKHCRVAGCKNSVAC